MGDGSDTADRNMLEAVITNDHLVLGGLLVELSRTPDTPGVMAGLAATMVQRERVHMAVVEQVLFPVLAEGNDYSVVEAVVTNHQVVRQHLDQLVHGDRAHRYEAVRQLEDDLADQFAFESGVLVPAVEQAPAADPGHLGFQLSRLTAAGLSESLYGAGDLGGPTIGTT